MKLPLLFLMPAMLAGSGCLGAGSFLVCLGDPECKATMDPFAIYNGAIGDECDTSQVCDIDDEIVCDMIDEHGEELEGVCTDASDQGTTACGDAYEELPDAWDSDAILFDGYYDSYEDELSGLTWIAGEVRAFHVPADLAERGQLLFAVNGGDGTTRQPIVEAYTDGAAINSEPIYTLSFLFPAIEVGERVSSFDFLAVVLDDQGVSNRHCMGGPTVEVAPIPVGDAP